MSGECPVPLGALSPARPGQSEDYGSARDDDIIEEAGPADDASLGSDLSALVVPFPDLAPVVFFCLKQTTCPRSWCIRMVLSPYPLGRRAEARPSLVFHPPRLQMFSHICTWRLINVERFISSLSKNQPLCLSL